MLQNSFSLLSIFYSVQPAESEVRQITILSKCNPGLSCSMLLSVLAILRTKLGLLDWSLLAFILKLCL